MKEQPDLEDVQTDLVAMMYYLYRQAGCPMGDTLQGMISWRALNVQGPFERMVELDEERDR